MYVMNEREKERGRERERERERSIHTNKFAPPFLLHASYMYSGLGGGGGGGGIPSVHCNKKKKSGCTKPHTHANLVRLNHKYWV